MKAEEHNLKGKRSLPLSFSLLMVFRCVTPLSLLIKCGDTMQCANLDQDGHEFMLVW